MTTTGSPVGPLSGVTSQCSSAQSASSSPCAQRQQSTPPSPRRGGSTSTGGASGRGSTVPWNGHVSHSSTGGILSAPCVRCQNASGLSGTRLLVVALPLLVALELVGGTDVAQRRVVRREALRRLDVELLREHGAERLDLHLAEAGQRADALLQVGAVACLRPDPRRVAAV